MSKLRKTSVLALSLTLAMSALAGCGAPKEEAKGDTAADVKKEGFPIVDKPLTLKIMSQDAGKADWNTMPALQEMEKLTGIKMEYQLTPIDSFETKKNLVYTSGNLPDILLAADIRSAEQVNYGEQGILLPLDKYIDEGYAPNIKKLFDENPQIRQSFTTPNGHIYSIPFIDLAAVWYRAPLWYNGKHLKKLGMTELPKTTDELYTYLKRVKDEDANGNGKQDEIPLTSVKLNDIRQYFLSFWGMPGPLHYADKAGKVRFAPQEEGYKGYLAFMNRLWNEKLLDHETFSQTEEQKKAKGKNNQVALANDYFPYFTFGGEPNEDHPMMTLLKSEVVDSPVYGKHPGFSGQGTLAITSSNANPEASMRWIDYLYSTEGATLFKHGPENLLWKYSDKDTWTKEWLPVPNGEDREEYKGKVTPNHGILFPGVNSTDLNKGFVNNFELWVDKQNQEKLIPYSVNAFPGVYLTNEHQTEASAIYADVRKYVEQMEAKFVTGQEPLANWDKYVAQLKKMGTDRYVELYQGAYDQWASKK
ncbi:extracellular solute-binding protein [Paenibacillus sp. N1-5-1-14]|uniref:extracellular solute-binding protein n=1 Tax=Paenibacillus radicibacter TaxID=2972488 RepID=UPI0021598889|nr:extracellular solute-binding protein [Paenibacillus radicibacter]MCR8641136.1 extracellular solute-binding protein [Paenibacillus radicibacter]